MRGSGRGVGSAGRFEKCHPHPDKRGRRATGIGRAPRSQYNQVPNRFTLDADMREEIIKLFRQLTYGVYVIGVAEGKVCNAFTAAWVMQVSFHPLLLALSINTQHSSYELLARGKVV